MKHYYVYILTNFKNTVLYTGVTNDLIKRIYQHKNKLVRGFTQKYQVTKLVYYEIFNDPTAAIAREKAIKNLLKSKKDALIKSFNPNWEDLYGKIIE